MSLATTIAKVASILESVPGIENVLKGPLVTQDRQEAEDALSDDLHLQGWGIAYSLFIGHLGAQAAAHTEVDVVIRARRECVPGRERETFLELAQLVEAGGQALIVEGSGLPQIDGNGIQVESGDQPVLLDTGHVVWESLLKFHLLNVIDS